MKVAVERDAILQIANAVKELPVDCSKFDTAYQWVGIIVTLEGLAQGEPQAEETFNEE